MFRSTNNSTHCDLMGAFALAVFAAVFVLVALTGTNECSSFGDEWFGSSDLQQHQTPGVSGFSNPGIVSVGLVVALAGSQKIPHPLDAVVGADAQTPWAPILNAPKTSPPLA